MKLWRAVPDPDFDFEPRFALVRQNVVWATTANFATAVTLKDALYEQQFLSGFDIVNVKEDE